MPPVRSLLVLTLLAACELKPPPPKAQPAPGSGSAAAVEAKAPMPVPAPAPTPPPTPPPAATPPAEVNAGSGSGSGPAISEACVAVAVHITDILIANGDQTQRAFMEQERARTVRQSELSCQRNHWNDDKIKCFTAASKFAELDACNKMP
jgi:hypothetical protein